MEAAQQHWELNAMNSTSQGSTKIEVYHKKQKWPKLYSEKQLLRRSAVPESWSSPCAEQLGPAGLRPDLWLLCVRAGQGLCFPWLWHFSATPNLPLKELAEHGCLFQPKLAWDCQLPSWTVSTTFRSTDLEVKDFVCHHQSLEPLGVSPKAVCFASSHCYTLFPFPPAPFSSVISLQKLIFLYIFKCKGS